MNGRIKQLREERSLSQQELADILEISQSSLGNYERGVRIPDANVLSKMADIFYVSTDYIIGRIDQKWRADEPVEEVTGLDGDAIQKLNTFKKSPEVVNLFIGYRYFPRLIDSIANYISVDEEMVSYSADPNDSREIEITKLMRHTAIRDFERILDELRERVQADPELCKRIQESE